MIETPGIYQIPAEVYHSDPCIVPSLSRGIAKCLIEQTPAHAKAEHPRLNPDMEEPEEQEEQKFAVGTAAHSLFLEGTNVGVMVDPAQFAGARGGIPKGWTNDAIRVERDRIRAEGKIPMLPKQYEKVMAMVDVAKSALFHSEYALQIGEMLTEQSYFWQEKGIWCRARLDAITQAKTLILDYKTTGMLAAPEAWAKNVDEMQHAFYLRAVKAVDGIKPSFVFMVQEDWPPYAVSFIRLSGMYAEMGEEKVNEAIELWKLCTLTNEWPAYSLLSTPVDPPPFKLSAWEGKRFMLQVAQQGDL